MVPSSRFSPPNRLFPGPSALLLLVLLLPAHGQTPYRLARPETGEVTRFVTLPGSIRPHQEVTLFAKIPGYLASLPVDRGDRVTAGQVLATLEAPELDADRARAAAEVAAARIDFDRVSAAHGKAPDLVMAREIDEARARLDIARARLEAAETYLQYTTLTAPWAGAVTTRHLHPGAYLAPGTTPLLTLVDFSSVRVTVPVPETEAVHVRPGQPIQFTAAALPGRTFAATVSRLAYSLDPATQSITVEATLPNPDGALLPGLFITARLGVETHPGVLRLPADAVLFEKAGASVFLYRDGQAVKTPVKTGFRNDQFVEILPGLASADSVLRFGATPPTPGQPVSIVP